jgi:hypothetical protein
MLFVAGAHLTRFAPVLCSRLTIVPERFYNLSCVCLCVLFLLKGWSKVLARSYKLICEFVSLTFMSWIVRDPGDLELFVQKFWKMCKLCDLFVLSLKWFCVCPWQFAQVSFDSCLFVLGKSVMCHCGVLEKICGVTLYCETFVGIARPLLIKIEKLAQMPSVRNSEQVLVLFMCVIFFFNVSSVVCSVM